MQYITAHYVDAGDGVPATLAPLRNGPALPSKQIAVDFVDFGKTPALIVGTLPDNVSLPAACTAIDEATHASLLAAHQAQQAAAAAALQQQLIADLADYRFSVETGGISIDGQTILTDRESQAQLNGALQSLTSGFVASVDWKAAAGWMTVTLAVIQPIGAAVAQHVQACFTAERQVSEQIAAGTLTTAMVDAFDAALAAIKAGDAAAQPGS